MENKWVTVKTILVFWILYVCSIAKPKQAWLKTLRTSQQLLGSQLNELSFVAE